MRIIFHYKSHLLRPKSHKRCPSIKLWFENIWNRHFVKKFKTSHPNLLILNGENQLLTHKYDRVKIVLWRNYIDFVLFSATWHSFKIQSPFYPVWYSILTTWFQHPNHLTNLTTLTIQPIKQINCPNQPNFPEHLTTQNILTSDQPAGPK